MKKKMQYIPLTGGYMATSMMGFLISIIYVYNFSESSKPWGIAFATVFAAMFIASIGTMTRADPESYVYVETKTKKKST